MRDVNGLVGGDGTYVGDQAGTAVDGLGKLAEHGFALGGGLQKGLARAAAHIKAVQALGQLEFGQRRQHVQVQRTIGLEGRNKSGEHASQGVCGSCSGKHWIVREKGISCR